MSPSPACASSTASAPAGCTPHEIGQIAGRAGRYRTRRHLRRHRRGARRWTRTWSSAVENHRFEPVDGGRVAQRQARLRHRCTTCCARWPRRPTRDGLKLAGRGAGRDHAAPLAEDEDVGAASRDRAEPACGCGRSARRPTSARPRCDEHVRLARDALRAPDRAATGGCPTTGSRGQFAALDRTDGEIDALAARLAGVRTLAYVANRPDWLRDPASWQATDPRAGGPALRHPAREADGAVRRPAHQRADAGAAACARRCWPASPPTAR